MPDWFSANAPKASPAAAPAGGGDWFDLYSPERKPVSSEDFAPPQRDVSVGNMLWNAAKSIPAGIAGTAKAIYNDQRQEDTALGPAGPLLGPLGRMAAAGATSEAVKTAADLKRGRLSEAAGHAAATVLPLVGPAAAAAGEDIGSGDTERIERGGGNAIGLVGGMLAPGAVAKVAPRVAPALATIGEQLAAKGRSVASAAGPAVMEIAKTLPVELAAHYLGGPLGSGVVARVLLKNVLDTAKGAKGAAAEVAPNAGGRVVAAKAPTLTQELTDALAEVRQPSQPARVTTPPPAGLPPGYTPRSTVPKARQAKASLPAERAPAAAPAAPSTRAYFLKPAEQVAAEAAPADAVTASGSIDLADLPASWRTHTGQDIFPVTGAEGAEVAAALMDELATRGLSRGEAMALVSKNKDIPTKVRSQLIRAIGAAKGKKGVK